MCSALALCRPDEPSRMRWSLLLFRLVARHLLDCRAYVADGAVGSRIVMISELYCTKERKRSSLSLIPSRPLALGDILDLGDEVEGFALGILTRERSAKPTPCGLQREKALLQWYLGNSPSTIRVHKPN